MGTEARSGASAPFDRIKDQGLSAAAAMDALAFFATAGQIEQAARALDRGEFAAWSAGAQASGAAELRALAECYHATEREAQGDERSE